MQAIALLMTGIADAAESSSGRMKRQDILGQLIGGIIGGLTGDHHHHYPGTLHLRNSNRNRKHNLI